MKSTVVLFYIIALLSCVKDELPPAPIIHAPVVIDSTPVAVVEYMDFPIIIAQSNNGRAINPIRDTVKNAFIMSYNTVNENHFGPLIRGRTSSDKINAFGIQYYLAKNYTATGKEIYIFQSALGGQPINQWAPDSILWKYTVKGIQTAKDLAVSKGKVARFPYAIFYQGESDAESKLFDSTQYQRALESVITRTRIETATATKFFIIEFPTCYRDIRGNMEKIRGIQKTVGSQPNNRTIFNSASDRCIDMLHIDSTTLKSKADAIFKIIN